MKKCNKCGTEIKNDNAIFCNECGARIEDITEIQEQQDNINNQTTDENNKYKESELEQGKQSIPSDVQSQNIQQPQMQYSQPPQNQIPPQGQPQFVQGQPQYVQGQPQYIQGQPQFIQGQPQYVQGQPQYVPVQQYYQQPAFVQQPAYTYQPPKPVDPKELLIKTAGSGKFLAGAIFHIAAFLMVFLSVFMLGAIVTTVLSSSWITGVMSASDIEDLNNALSGPALVIIISILLVPLVALLTGIIITFIGGKTQSAKTAKVGMIIMFVMLIIVLLILVALPILVVVYSYIGSIFTSWLLAISIVWLALTVFLVLPMILMDMKAIRILKGIKMEKYTFPVVSVSLVFSGILIILESLPLIITFQWIYILAAICLGVSCFIFTSVVKGYNRQAKNSI